MSIWGKIGGAAAGFIIGGGPIGAALGALAGHAVFDRVPGEDEKQLAFTMGVTALAAKMAKADGQSTDAEFNAFKRIVHIEPGFEGDVRRVYNLAHETVAGFESYASQLGRLFRDNPGLLEDLLDALFFVAAADGTIHDSELEYLHEVARRFGISDAAFNNLCASYGGPCEPDPYALFNIDPDATNEELRKAYLQAVRENHPDRMMARGAPAEFLAVANEKLARINTAYAEIRKARGL